MRLSMERECNEDGKWEQRNFFKWVYIYLTSKNKQ